MTVKSLEDNTTSQDQDMGQEPATQTGDAARSADAKDGVCQTPIGAATCFAQQVQRVGNECHLTRLHGLSSAQGARDLLRPAEPA
jgi:hypothetical protein